MTSIKRDVIGVAGAWTKVCTADGTASGASVAVTAVRVQPSPGAYTCRVQVTATSTPPSADAAGLAGALFLYPQQGWAGNVTIADLYPGETSGHVWLWSDVGGEVVSVAHNA